MGHPELFNVAQTLEIMVGDDVVNEFGRDTDEPVNRIIYYFLLVQSLKIVK